MPKFAFHKMLSAVIFFTVQTVSEGGLYAKKNEKEKERGAL